MGSCPVKQHITTFAKCQQQNFKMNATSVTLTETGSHLAFYAGICRINSGINALIRKEFLLMEELVKSFLGKKIDVSCGTSSVIRGEVIEITNGVLLLRDEDEKAAYISIDKISSIYECSDSASRPGFIA